MRLHQRSATVPVTIVAGASAIGVLAIALLGPLLAPHSPTEPVAAPYTGPGPGHLLGSDSLGRDVLSRTLRGGFALLSASTLACLASTAAGATVGILAALAGGRHHWWEGLLMRPLDAIAAIPPIITLLLVLSAFPTRSGVIIAGAVTGTPLAARVALASTKPLLARSHVEIARARGESPSWIALHELAPIAGAPIIADTGLRFIAAFYLVTAAGFLGIDLGGTDWGTLLVEALPGVALQPLAMIVPLLLIATLAISVNLLVDRLVQGSTRLLG